MSSQLFNLLASGSLVEVDLLLRVPNSSDMSAYVKPGWRGYSSVFAQTTVVALDNPAGMQFLIQAQFLASEGIWEIEAVAVSLQGSLIFVAPLNQSAFATPQTPFPVRVQGVISAVLQ